MNEISFKSRIRTVTEEEFNKIAQRIGREFSSNYPWTVNQGVVGRSAYTRNFEDCLVLGITDGEKISLKHLCPTRPENKDLKVLFEQIKKDIQIMKQEYLQAFVLGSKNNPESSNFFRNILNFLDMTKIPTSYLRCGKNANHAAYSSINDELLISNSKIKQFSNSSENLKREFEEIKLSEFDEIV